MTNLYAEDSDNMFNIGRMNVSINQGDNGDTNPNIQFPITWNENFFSEMSYSSYSTTTIQDLISVMGKSSSYTQKNSSALSLNYLHKLSKQHTITIGVLASYYDSIGSEFGYYEVNATTNSINLDINYKEFKVGIKGDYTYVGDKIPLNFRVGFILHPFTKLNLDQSSVISGGVGEGTHHSSSNQNMSYAIYLVMQYPIYKDVFFIGIDANLNSTPLEYDSLVLDPNTNQFTTTQITQEEIVSKVNYKLIYKQYKDSPINYVIGYSKQKIHIKLEDNENNEDKKMFILGIERRF